MGRVVIVCYKEKSPHGDDLISLLKKHISVLREADLVTSMKPIILKSQHGQFLEIFEWKSKEAIEKAHHLPQITELWAEFEQCCTFEPLNSLEESAHLFAEFERLEL